MPLTKEQLLRPRYKVIADYPFRDHFLLNEIIELDQYDDRPHLKLNEWYVTKQKLDGTGLPLNWFESTLNKYPHLFRPLKWWEHREESDMPEYVKDENNNIHKVKKWISCGMVADYVDGHSGNSNYTLPATEQEYIDYINSK